MNTNTPWSDDDLYLLEAYLRNSSLSMSEIATRLKRSRSAVMTATRKIILQQLLHHPAEEVATHYGSTLREFRQLLGDTKYYIPIEDPAPHYNPLLPPICVALGIAVVTGIARFGMVLAQSPLLRHDK